MISSVELNNEELLQQFEDCTLNPSLFTHEVLLKLTWILINKYGLKEAIVKNCELKEQYYIKALKSKKFNIALTKAYTEILYHFMQKSTTKDFDKLLREFPRLKYNFKDLVRTHYGYDILKEHRKEVPPSFNPILFTF
ncbi:hypothetical protein [Lutibacter sp. B1]|uniref:hypothetical protein n=1 Tax=Lutibacter sp. B1 TaxID=2725996 RepID=UPI0014568DB7|nr:hypothetical protein [Lutibacter sp. B1]NLP56570.1 hypothetical protein [Lutibacter sp. B1]